MSVDALFADHLRMRSLIRSALDGHQGFLLVDDPTNPSVAILTTGRFITLGGDFSNPLLEAELGLQEPAWVVPENDVWTGTVEGIFAGRVRWRARTRYAADTLDPAGMRARAEAPPEACAVEPISRATAVRIARPDGSIGAFPDVTAFLRRGIGFCARVGEEPVGYAISYATYDAGIEIDLWVHEDHRRRGLATCLSARLIDHCLERGLEPHWDADNEISAGLAQKLGYRRVEDYRMLRKLYRNEPVPR